jgi:Caspase domain
MTHSLKINFINNCQEVIMCIQNRKGSFLGLLVLIGMVVFPTFSLAATLHAILVGDTNDASIGTSVQVDQKKLQGLIKSISEYTGMTLSPHYVSGNQLNLANVRQAINSVSAGSNDVILFYWSGHGFNANNDDSVFPTMNIKGYTETLGLSAVKDMLRQKGPRLLLVIGDTCNKPGGSSGREVEARNEKPENYKKLFLNHRGTIIASGSRKGQYSYGNPQSGGLYTRAFLSSLSTELASEGSPNWDNLMKRAEAPINVGQDHAGRPVIQEPQSVVEVGPVGPVGPDTNNVGPDNSDPCGGVTNQGTKQTCGALGPSAQKPESEDDDSECKAGTYRKKDGGKTECCETDSGGERCWPFKF